MSDADPPDAEPYLLQLFVMGGAPRSRRAVANIRILCEERLAERYALEIIDIHQNPAATRDQQVIATPTLVKIRPAPTRRVVGDLSDRRRVLAGLGLPEAVGDPA